MLQSLAHTATTQFPCISSSADVRGVHCMCQIPDFGCCGLHYGHKFPVAQRAANITREIVFKDPTVDNMVPQVVGATLSPSNTLSVDIHLNSTKGLMLKPTYMCESKVAIVSSASETSVNASCCTSTPAGFEGVGIVKMLINATHHPRHYWGGWVAATLKIVSDTLVTATAFIPADVNATEVQAVDVNLGGMGCVLANANGQPLGTVAPIVLTQRH
eukprot:m.201675 g.201675  ORF g.201675 m.201675 type:complete len:216 (+) comp18804_c0_seq14:1480-2127(+)